MARRADRARSRCRLGSAGSRAGRPAPPSTGLCPESLVTTTGPTARGSVVAALGAPARARSGAAARHRVRPGTGGIGPVAVTEVAFAAGLCTANRVTPTATTDEEQGQRPARRRRLRRSARSTLPCPSEPAPRAISPRRRPGCRRRRRPCGDEETEPHHDGDGGVDALALARRVPSSGVSLPLPGSEFVPPWSEPGPCPCPKWARCPRRRRPARRYGGGCVCGECVSGWIRSRSRCSRDPCASSPRSLRSRSGPLPSRAGPVGAPTVPNPTGSPTSPAVHLAATARGLALDGVHRRRRGARRPDPRGCGPPWAVCRWPRWGC